MYIMPYYIQVGIDYVYYKTDASKRQKKKQLLREATGKPDRPQ